MAEEAGTVARVAPARAAAEREPVDDDGEEDDERGGRENPVIDDCPHGEAVSRRPVAKVGGGVACVCVLEKGGKGREGKGGERREEKREERGREDRARKRRGETHRLWGALHSGLTVLS